MVLLPSCLPLFYVVDKKGAFLLADCLQEDLHSVVFHFICIKYIFFHCGFQVLMSQTLHNCFGLCAVLCQDCTVCVSQAVIMEKRIFQFIVNDSCTVFE